MTIAGGGLALAAATDAQINAQVVERGDLGAGRDLRRGRDERQLHPREQHGLEPRARVPRGRRRDRLRRRTVDAANNAGIDAPTRRCTAAVSPTNDAGAGILNNVSAGQLARRLPVHQRTRGRRRPRSATRVRVADDYAGAAVVDPRDPTGRSTSTWAPPRASTSAPRTTATTSSGRSSTPTNLITDSLVLRRARRGRRRLDKEGLTGGADSYFGLVDHNDVRSDVESVPPMRRLTAGGDGGVSRRPEGGAHRRERRQRGPAVGRLRRRHRHERRARARPTPTIDRQRRDDRTPATSWSTPTTSSQIDATATSQIEAWTAIGAVLAFNSIGWKPSNILFNAVDALLGDPLISTAFDGEQPSDAQAYIRDTTVDSAGGVDGDGRRPAQFNATVGQRQHRRRRGRPAVRQGRQKGEKQSRDKKAGKKGSRRLRRERSRRRRHRRLEQGLELRQGLHRFHRPRRARRPPATSRSSRRTALGSTRRARSCRTAVTATTSRGSSTSSSSSSSRATTTTRPRRAAGGSRAATRCASATSYAGGGDTGSIYRYQGLGPVANYVTTASGTLTKTVQPGQLVKKGANVYRYVGAGAVTTDLNLETFAAPDWRRVWPVDVVATGNTQAVLLTTGTLVQLSPGWSGSRGTPGAIYRFLGASP